MEVEMRIRGLMMDPMSSTPIIILKEANGSSLLPIWVGAFEANAIASEIEKTLSPRPMTHDLLKNLLWSLGATIRKVVITEIVNNTFYAVLEISHGDSISIIDARPSDAIALALRADSPIYVEQEVLNNSGAKMSELEQSAEDTEWSDDLLDDTSDYKM